MQASFHMLEFRVMENCVAAIEAMRFSCVASAAHFLIMEGIICIF